MKKPTEVDVVPQKFIEYSFIYALSTTLCTSVRLARADKSIQADAIAALELQTKTWYEWDGRVFNKPPAPLSRPVKRSRQQPTHLIEFVPFEGVSGETERWLVMADEFSSDGTAYSEVVTWTHKEWQGRSDSEGSWKRIDGVWYCNGQTTPGGRAGLVSVEPLGGQVIIMENRRRLASA